MVKQSKGYRYDNVLFHRCESLFWSPLANMTLLLSHHGRPNFSMEAECHGKYPGMRVSMDLVGRVEVS